MRNYYIVHDMYNQRMGFIPHDDSEIQFEAVPKSKLDPLYILIALVVVVLGCGGCCVCACALMCKRDPPTRVYYERGDSDLS